MATLQYTIGQKVEISPKYGEKFSGKIHEIVYIIKRDTPTEPLHSIYQSQESAGKLYEFAGSSRVIGDMVESMTYNNVHPGLITSIITEGGTYKKVRYSKKTRRNRY